MGLIVCATLKHLNCFFFLEWNSEQANHVRRSRFNLVFVYVYVCKVAYVHILSYILISLNYFSNPYHRCISRPPVDETENLIPKTY